MKAATRIILLACALSGLVPRQGAAQYPFGKNKVTYAPKDWKIIETAHLEIYYYEDELPIAEFIAGLSDSVCGEFAGFFAFAPGSRIPVILYGTHHDFKETNVTPYLVSESTAGFTEFIKGRIALPFDGSYGKLEKVFRHEVAHAFMLEKLSAVMSGHRHFNYNNPPLWFVEGLAEYLANRGLDTEAHMFMRDAVTSGLLYPLEEIWRIEGSYLMYKEGESALHYLATRFGEESVRLILENWWRSDRFDFVLRGVTGMTLQELSEDWQAYLKRRYYPAILDRRGIGEITWPLAMRDPAFEIHPACAERAGRSPRVFCVGYDRGSINILELEPGERGKGKRTTFIRGGMSNEFESIPPLRSRISARGDTLLFVSKSGARDAVYLYDIERRRVLRKVSAPGVRILSSPTLSPDGRRIAFAGLDGFGKSDLYLYDLDRDTCERLTEDYYADESPDWHPVRNLLVFSSDRHGIERGASSALFTIDTETRDVAALTEGGRRDVDPRWMPDGRGIIFSSDRGGAPDIYVLEEGHLTRQTSVLGGAFGPYPFAAGDSFLCASYSAGTYRCYRLPLTREAAVRQIVPPPYRPELWQPALAGDTTGIVRENYRIRFGVDFIGAMFAVDPDFGGIGNGAQLFLTDMLGDHQISILFGSASESFDYFFQRLNLALTYTNLSRRLNYAVGAFHLASYVSGPSDLVRYERRYGVLGAISYPFTAFRRADFTTVLRRMDRNDEITYFGMEEGQSWIFSNFISYTFDNIVWYIGGPLGGRRFNVTIGNSLDLEGSRYESTTFQVDFRNYITLTDRLVFAQRIVSRNAWGSDLQLFYLGGAWDLRGYPFHGFAGKRTLLLNNELRFPFLDRLALRFPVGGIEFPLFRGSLFLDAGKVDGYVEETGWIGSVGAGVEMNLGYLPVARVNFSRLTDFRTIESDVHVDLFLGFNF